MIERKIFYPVRPQGEFLAGRRTQTKELGKQILGVLPELKDSEFGFMRKAEIADYLSVRDSRVEYVTRLLKTEGFIFVHQARIVGYYSAECQQKQK